MRAKIAARTQTGDPVRAKAAGRLPAPRPNTYYVYVIECENGSHYIGQTDDLQRRWEEHKEGKVEWTKRHKPVRIAHYEEFSTREEAVKRESDLKTGFGRKWLKKLIASGRARQAGQPVGMDAGTALSACDAQAGALFPDSFHDSPLGRIPKGWAIRRLGDVVGVNERSISSKYAHRTIRYVEISSVDRGKLLRPTLYELREAPSRAKRLVSHGDTIWSCVRPNRKAYLFVHNPTPNLVVSTGFAVLTPKKIVPTYLYAWVTTDAFVEYLSYSADGSAYPAVRPERFAAAETLVPASGILREFEQIAGPMRDKIANNDRESRTLAAVRDTLLPKLISGEIRVKDAEKLAEKAI